MIEENKSNNFFKMMLTETSTKSEDEVGLLEKEKEQLLEDLDNKKISQEAYDKRLQEIDTKISDLKSASYKAEAESVKSSNNVSGEKSTEEEQPKEKIKVVSVQENKERQAEKNLPVHDKIKVESRSEQLPYYEQKEDLEEVIMQKIQELKTIQSGNPIKINQEKFDPQEFISDKGEAAIPQSIPAILGQRNVQPLRNEQSTRSLNSIGDSGLILQMQKVLDVSWRTLSY